MKKIKLLLLLSCIAFLQAHTPDPIDESAGGYSVGSKVEDFKLEDALTGQSISLSDFRDVKGFILVFYSNTCPVVHLYEDRIIQLHKDFALLGYPVVAVNANDAVKYPAESKEAMKARHQEKKYPFFYLKDETQEVARRFGATRTPHTYLIEKKDNGDMKVAYIGAIDDRAQKPEEVGKQYVRNAVNRMIKGKRIKKSHTKAVGCTIKWAE